MAYNRFLLNQLLPAGNDKTIYELILDEPYSAGRKPSDAADSLAAKTPADVAVGSKATYITEDANGNRVVWKFTYQQTAVDETGWVITKVLEGGMAPIPLEVTVNAKYEGNGATAYTPVDVDVPNPSTGTLQITENGEGINVSSYAYVDVNVSGGMNYPTFVQDDSTPPVVFSVDMTYAQAKAYVLEYADENGFAPLSIHYIFSDDAYYAWEKARFIDGADIQAYIGVPVDVTEGVDLYGVLYGSDENFYQLGD